MVEAMPVPVMISPEAAARVAELGMQREFQQMLEHMRQTVPDLCAIEVTLDEPYEMGDEPRVILEAVKRGPYVDTDRTEWNWSYWKVGTFSPDVFRHFVMALTGDSP